MLVLSRHREEEIVLELEDGRTIAIKNVGIHGNRVRIGVAAPMSVQIHRREIYDEILTARQPQPTRAVEPAVA